MRLLMPAALAAAAWLHVSGAQAAEAAAAWVPLSGASAALLLAVCALEWGARRRFSLLRDEARQLTGAAGLPEREGLAALEEKARTLEAQAREEGERTALARRQRAESEGLFALAVERANDGMWEWDFKAGTAWFSPRWRSMLGRAPSEAAGSVTTWHDHVHPDDRPAVTEAIESHLAGRTPRVELEHRMRHRDGTWRWVLTRAQALRHASGAPYRLVGLDIDVTTRYQVCAVLAEASENLFDLSGEDCYRELVSRFARAVGMEEVFLCECCDVPATRVRMLAHWRHGEFAALKEFELAGTPCDEVIGGSRVVYAPRRMGERWPRERASGAEAYLGLPCVDSRGSVIGHIACKSWQEMRPELPHDAVLRLFAMRASMEMERRTLAMLRGRLPQTGH